MEDKELYLVWFPEDFWDKVIHLPIRPICPRCSIRPICLIRPVRDIVPYFSLKRACRLATPKPHDEGGSTAFPSLFFPKKQPQDEERVANYIPFKKPLGFLREAIAPF